MKRKYYLRGIGIGIIFAAIIMSIAYNTSDKNKLTDEKIIEKAKELGMVFEEENSKIDELLSTITPTPTPTEEISEGEASTEAESTKDKPEAITPTKEPVKEPAKEAETKENQEISKADETKEQMVKIKITYGMSSEGVAKLLESKGIIEDSAAFNQYLILNKYTKDIGTGTYEIEPFLSYKEITDIIILKYQKNN